LTTASQAKIEQILARFSRQRDSLIPILQEVQQQYGYLPAEAMQEIADYLHLASSTVYSIGTFYSQFRFVPGGRSSVKICCGTACHVRGGARLLHDTERQLGIKPGETTTDGEYNLETVACVGACALAPVVIVDDRVYGRMTSSDARSILEANRKADDEAEVEVES
jgi:NADH-quinone oxidoreductase E subunit